MLLFKNIEWGQQKLDFNKYIQKKLQKFFIFCFYLIFYSCFLEVYSQETKEDSIFIKATLFENKNEIHVKQHFHLANKKKDTIYIHAWINAYSKKNSILSQKKLEERNPGLYYAKPEQRGGLFNLEFYTAEGEKLTYFIKNDELIIIPMPKNKPENRFFAHYSIKIPDNSFTNYGVDKEKNYYLKYFFLQPITYEKDFYIFQHHQGMETEMSNPTYYDVELLGIENKNVVTYLKNEAGHWKGRLNDVLEVDLLNNPPPELTIKNKKIHVAYSYDESPLTADLLQNQMQFLEAHLGVFPKDKIILTEKNKQLNTFFGLDDIRLSKKSNLEIFPSYQKEAILLFQQLSYEYLNQILHTNKQKDFWIKGGLQTYLSIKYIETAFVNVPGIMGNTFNNFKCMGIKPFNLFYFSQLPLTERYNLMYSFLSRFGNDQILNTPYDKLNKFNQEYVGSYRTGLIFDGKFWWGIV